MIGLSEDYTTFIRLKRLIMRHALISIFFCFILFSPALAQEFTDSNLPIVLINTSNNVPITDNPRVLASMKIIDRGNGERNYMTDQNNPVFLNYNGKIEIEIRGSSTQALPKKQYGFSTLRDDNITNNNVRLLGMPADNDWIFNGMVFDPSLMRDYLSYNLSRQIGEYASRTAYCEIVINGSYKGLYLLQEKIKSDNNRVDIIRLNKTDNTFPGLSGGYIIKADKTTGGDPIAWTMYSMRGSPIGYIHHEPEPDEVTPVQSDYIRSQFQVLETQAFHRNNSVTTGISSVIDIPSFINYMIINELTSNADAYMFSTFFHKDMNGKLRAGPVWDCDLTFGNDIFIWGFDRSKTNIWQFANGDNEGTRFWKDLFDNQLYKCYLSKRWNELIRPGEPLNIGNLELYIDSVKEKIAEAVVRENSLWGGIGNHQDQVTKIRIFLRARIEWISANLPAFSECSNVPVPPLVISKIMFHPKAFAEFTDNEDLEFIEITNNGSLDLNMEGIYFRGTGFVYQFPFYSTLKSNESIILASNAIAFRTRYGSNPHGQFTRHLSDKGQSIVLADGFGNIIDEVHYSDTIPWPEADGNGKYLKLNSLDLDNSIAANWSASEDIIVSEQSIYLPEDLILYPNPVIDNLIIKARTEIKQISLFDFQGRLLYEISVNQLSYELDTRQLSKGFYIINVITSERAYSTKIVKE